MGQSDLLMSRTMFCPWCNAHGRPQKGDRFVVYGSNAHDFHGRFCHQDGYTGFTPHIISFDRPLVYKDGKIQLTKTCGVHGASYRIENQKLIFDFKDVEYFYISPEDFKALMMKWLNTGYEII